MKDPSASVKPVTNQDFKQDSAGKVEKSITGARLLVPLLVTYDLIGLDLETNPTKCLGPFPIFKIGTTNPLPSPF